MIIKKVSIIIGIICNSIYAIELNNNNLQNLFKSREITKSQSWRPIQERIYNTVVQVFSQKAQFDWLQPFRTPEQYATRGSGFFINNKGELLTNWHVIDQAVAVWIQIPSLGKRLIKVNIVGVCPSSDIALLRVEDEELALITNILDEIPFLPLGDSDDVHRADEVMALGYPLGQESLKCTTGIISGREQYLIQTSAPINLGSSGGPLINIHGEVIGINVSGVTVAQNVGYAIPINHYKTIEANLRQEMLLKEPFLGIIPCNRGSNYLAQWLGNPVPGGLYICEVIPNSPLERAGIKPGDMIYEINDYRLDVYGEMSVPWSEDKISFLDYLARLSLDENITLMFYRNGEQKKVILQLSDDEISSVRMVYPWHEEVDYEVFAGMVVMQLTLNHIKIFNEQASSSAVPNLLVPGLMRYARPGLQNNSKLIIAHVFHNSELARLRLVVPGYTINEVNGIKVTTLDEFRSALTKSLENNYFIMKLEDQVQCMSDNIPVVLPLTMVLNEVVVLSHLYRYPISDSVKKLLHQVTQINKSNLREEST